MKEIFVAEYNFGQKQFHHDTLISSIAKNKRIIERAYREKKDIQNVAWIPFAIGSDEETRFAINEMERYFEQNNY